jgi:hypothetical protein
MRGLRAVLAYALDIMNLVARALVAVVIAAEKLWVSRREPSHGCGGHGRPLR